MMAVVGTATIVVYASPVWLFPWLVARYAPWLLAGVFGTSTHAVSLSVPITQRGAPGVGAFLVTAGIGTVVGAVTLFGIIGPLTSSRIMKSGNSGGKTVVGVVCVLILATAAGVTGALGVAAFDHGSIHYPPSLTGKVFAVSNLPLYGLLTRWLVEL